MGHAKNKTKTFFTSGSTLGSKRDALKSLGEINSSFQLSREVHLRQINKRHRQDAIHGKQGNDEPSPVQGRFRFALQIGILIMLESK